MREKALLALLPLNLPLRLATLLKDLGHDVHTVHEERLMGHRICRPDKTVALFGRRRRFAGVHDSKSVAHGCRNIASR